MSNLCLSPSFTVLAMMQSWNLGWDDQNLLKSWMGAISAIAIERQRQTVREAQRPAVYSHLVGRRLCLRQDAKKWYQKIILCVHTHTWSCLVKPFVEHFPSCLYLSNFRGYFIIWRLLPNHQWMRRDHNYLSIMMEKVTHVEISLNHISSFNYCLVTYLLPSFQICGPNILLLDKW